MLLALCIVLVSGIALSAWYRAIGPDLTVQLAHFPAMPVWMFPFAGFGFSLGNAVMEEFAYRGIILQALDSAAGPGLLSLLVQAWLFGALHYREGFPNGAWGLVMTAVYGIMLGVLRRRSQGMLAPWAVHVFADCVIFTILAGMVLKSAG
jgi:membrane protease YdiL (CAAX protease family)